MPTHSPLTTDELLEDETLDTLLEEDRLLEETLDGVLLLEGALEATLLELEVITVSQAPRSFQALLAAQPTPGS